LLPLTLKIRNASGTGKTEKIVMNNSSGTFKIKTDQKPSAIIVDPNTELLASFIIKEK